MVAVFAVALSACQFDPGLPAPRNQREVAVGVRQFVDIKGDVSLEMDLQGKGVSQAELEELARSTALAFGASVTASSVQTKYATELTDGVSVDISIKDAWTPALSQTDIDAAAVLSAASALGLDLEYLHWCPHYEYEIDRTAPPGLQTDPIYGCIVWDATVGFDSVDVTLGSERAFLIPNLAVFLPMLIAATWAIGQFLWAAVRRRPVQWRSAIVGIGAWFGIYMLYLFVLVARLPTASAIVTIEPASSPIGRVVDVATTFTFQAGLFSGLVAMGLAGIAALISLLITGGSWRRSPLGGSSGASAGS